MKWSEKPEHASLSVMDLVSLSMKMWWANNPQATPLDDPPEIKSLSDAVGEPAHEIKKAGQAILDFLNPS